MLVADKLAVLVADKEAVLVLVKEMVLLGEVDGIIGLGVTDLGPD